MFGVIYKATNLINKKIYIGQTTMVLSKRINKHRFDYKHDNSNSIFHKALRKYGEENFEWEIIDEARSRGELNQKELYWIYQYDSHDYSIGYNMSLGYGQGGYWHGKSHTEETKKKISLANKGSTHSEESKKIMSEVKIGKYANGGNPRARAVIQLSLDGEYLNEFETAKQAHEATGCYRQNITKCCKGQLKTTGGYKWIYKE